MRAFLSIANRPNLELSDHVMLHSEFPALAIRRADRHVQCWPAAPHRFADLTDRHIVSQNYAAGPKGIRLSLD